MNNSHSKDELTRSLETTLKRIVTQHKRLRGTHEVRKRLHMTITVKEGRTTLGKKHLRELLLKLRLEPLKAENPELANKWREGQETTASEEA